MPQADIDEFMKSSSIGIGIACDFSYLFVGTPRMLISVDVYSNVMTRKYVVVELQTNAGYDPEAVLKAQKKKHIGEIRAKITIYLMGFISALKSNGFLWDDSQFEMLLDGTESAMLILKAESKEDEHIDLAEGAMCLRSVFQGGFINLVNKDSFTSRDVALLSRFKKAEGNLIITSARKNPTANLCFHYFELISSNEYFQSLSTSCSSFLYFSAIKLRMGISLKEEIAEMISDKFAESSILAYLINSLWISGILFAIELTHCGLILSVFLTTDKMKELGSL